MTPDLTDSSPGSDGVATVTPEAVTERLLASGQAPEWIGAPALPFVGFVTDSRQVRPGTLFCAVPGTRTDGHDFVPAALRDGATACLVEHDMPEASGPLLITADARLAAAHLASLFAGDPAAAMRLVGVTGTNGKTTSVFLLRHLLSALGPTAALGTLGVWAPDGDGFVLGAGMTTPGPIALMEDLTALREANTQFLAMEVSSHALVQSRVSALSFECVMFTNLTREHLDYHPDMEAYRAAKLRLGALIEPRGTAVVNADDPAWLGVEFGSAKVTRFGLDSTADVRATHIHASLAGTSFRLVTPAGSAEVMLPILGSVNVANALGAAAAAQSMGLGLPELAGKLSHSPQVPGRMEVLARSPGLIVRDYAHTPDAFVRTGQALSDLAEGRLFILFGCGGDRDRGKRPLMGEAAAQFAHRVMVTADNPRSEDPGAIAAEIVQGLESSRYEVVLDRREAIAQAVGWLGPTDVLLLAGKGHETYQQVGTRRFPFDEARIITELTQGDGS